MKKRIYLYVLLTFLCGFAINLQAAVVSLGTEDTPLPKANFVEKTETGDLSLMGEIVMKSTHCTTGIKKCLYPKVGTLKDGYSNCYASCACSPEYNKTLDESKEFLSDDEGCSVSCTNDSGPKLYKGSCVYTICPVGQQSKADGGCENCPIGTYKSNPSDKECTVCPAGTYNTSTGNRYASSCRPCTAGYFCPGDVVENIPDGEKPGTRIPCPAGTDNNPPVPTHSVSIDSCRECPTCSYASREGTQICYPCVGIVSENKDSCANDQASISCPSGYTYNDTVPGCRYHGTAAVTSANFCYKGKISTTAQLCRNCIECYSGYKLVNGKCEGCTENNTPPDNTHTIKNDNPGCNASSRSQKTYADPECGTGNTTWYSGENCNWNQYCDNGTCRTNCSDNCPFTSTYCDNGHYDTCTECDGTTKYDCKPAPDPEPDPDPGCDSSYKYTCPSGAAFPEYMGGRYSCTSNGVTKWKECVCQPHAEWNGSACVAKDTGSSCSLSGYNISGSSTGAIECKTCDGVKKCRSCSSKYKVSGSSCVAKSCSELNSSYKTGCSSGQTATEKDTTASGQKCYTCSTPDCSLSGYNLTNSSGATDCKTCNGLTKCKSCSSKYKVSGTSCVPKSCRDLGYTNKCPTGSYRATSVTKTVQGEQCYTCTPYSSFTRSCDAGTIQINTYMGAYGADYGNCMHLAINRSDCYGIENVTGANCRVCEIYGSETSCLGSPEPCCSHGGDCQDIACGTAYYGR